MRIAIVAPAPALRAGLRLLLADPVQNTPEASTWEAASLNDLTEADTATDVWIITAEALSDITLESWLSTESARTSDGISPAVLILTGLPALGRLAVPDHSALLQRVDTLRHARLRAWGLLPLDATAEELKAAVQALYEGLVVVPQALSELVFPSPGVPGTDEAADDAEKPGWRMNARADLQPEPLTEREGQVLQLLARGLGNKQIAVELGISEHTAKFHVSAIYSKLGAINRAEAVRTGIQRGLISL